MAVPRKKVSRSRRDALKPTGHVECSNCGEQKQPHHICQACGHYDGREVMEASGTV